MLELFKYRQLLAFLVKKELKIKYRDTIFGFFWSLLEPLGLMVIYSVVFSIILKWEIDNYALFLLAGLIPWMFFNNSINRGAKALTSNSSLIKKVYFPRQMFPLTVVTTNLVNLGISLFLVAILSFSLGVGIKLAALPWLIVIIVIQFILVFAITLLLSSVNVYYRDIEFISSLFLRGWMYLSPIIYPIGMVPDEYLSLYMLNPMTPIIGMYKYVFYGSEMMPLAYVAYSAIFAVVLLIISWKLFEKLSRRMGEVI
ncbi:ABC transporter permease [Alkalihalobacillus pseudalcaliphilus]|uniref:ABC transporter permease n=1 Tax=Alkalihalobacillus pseudalcaliphilus TaxID=79884 RepID=UPI00064E1406|nr:ABC transporter permease [Alkalihalobacillus pseudalcaliphilus]KMK77400.1 ABC transporter [Alkalihalobacillus pseudalcaliphilus]